MNINSSRKKVVLTNKNNLKLIRLTVFRSNKFIYGILINDANNTVISSVSSKLASKKGTPCELAHEVGQMIAEKAKKLKITEVVFDRSSYKYHGQVRSLAEGARKSGLKF